jgi:hypothetical protein
MKYAIETLLIEYHRLLHANRNIEQIACDPSDYADWIKANDARMKEIDFAIKALNGNNSWRL